MIRTLLILLCLLLCGCGAQTGQAPDNSENSPPIAAVREGQGQGSVRIFPLSGQQIAGLRVFGEDLLFFTEKGLVLLDAETLEARAYLEMEHPLTPEDSSLVIGEEEVSFYDFRGRQTVVLDQRLQEKKRIPDPERLQGVPLYSGGVLYYLSDTALRAWDLDSGLRRCVREFAGAVPEMAGLHLRNSVIACLIREGERERTLFLSGEDGRTLWEGNGKVILNSHRERYACILPAGTGEHLVFGKTGEEPQLLLPDGAIETCFFLDDDGAAVTVATDVSGVYSLDYYDLDSGRRISTLSLSSDHAPLAVEDVGNGTAYILMDDPGSRSQTLYCWAPWQAPLKDERDYLLPCEQTNGPDPKRLNACQLLAEEIGERYGIQIKLWKDAVSREPWDYRLEPEYQTAILRRELENLDKYLSRYPEKIFSQTGAHFASLNICIVRSLSGTENNATGLQFLDGRDAYVVIAAGPHAERTVYHELFHAMETHILTESVAFDRWDQLNPAGFQYDYDYEANLSRDSGVYLRREYRAFVDTFSMSYPKEDRARIMEYAMLPGNGELFRPETMQRKLRTLCQGIREAYELEEEAAVYPWEQYLKD